jgi:hypothetical protein
MKYKLTKNKKEYCGLTLFQIKAEMSFGDVEKGELGGYIEKEDNLSQEGNAWVSGNAKVSGNAEVYGDAKVSGDAWVYGNAKVSGKIKILAGYFFGYCHKKEEIKYVKVDDDVELIYKGEGKFEEENTKKDELLKR